MYNQSKCSKLNIFFSLSLSCFFYHQYQPVAAANQQKKPIMLIAVAKRLFESKGQVDSY